MTTNIAMQLTRAKAFAPASVANVAVGFDLLGFSADVAGDTAVVEKIDEPQVVVGEVTGLMTSLPLSPLENTATAGLVRLVRDRKLNFGFRVSIQKGIPLGSGLGGSAASAVAAIVAANELLEARLTLNEMLSYALIGEGVASGSFHADNVAPSLFGGLTLAAMNETAPNELPTVTVSELPIPEGLWCVLLHPNQRLDTKQARGILKPHLQLNSHIEASANLALFMTALFTSDFDLIRRSLRDDVIEPQRAHLIDGFYEYQKAAYDANALGCTISGAGPALFAWARGEAHAIAVKTSMLQATSGLARAWAFELKRSGARVVS